MLPIDRVLLIPVLYWPRPCPAPANTTPKLLKEDIYMPELEKKMGQAKKTEHELDPSKKGKEMDGSGTSSEVGGRTIYNLFVHCPYCHSLRSVDLDFEGQWFTCGNCGGNYQVWY